MKITEVSLGSDITESAGLLPVFMKRIDNIVLLAGKNGSGKTRILELIRQQAVNIHSLINQKKDTTRVLKRLNLEREKSKQQIKGFEIQIKQQPNQKKNILEQIKQQNQQIKNLEQQIKELPFQKKNTLQQIELRQQQIKNIKQQIEQQPQQKKSLQQQIEQQNQQIKNFKQQIEQQPQQKKSLQQQIEQQNQQIKNFEQQIEHQPQQKKNLQQQIEQQNQQIKNFEQQIEQQQEISKKEIPIQTDVESINIAVVDFVPTNLNLEDWATKPKKTWEQDAQQAKAVGVSSLSKSTLSLIQKIQEDWWEADHQNSEESAEVKKEATDEYKRLNDLIDEFLGTKLSRSKGYSTLFGKPIAETKLSLGQIVLLQLCIAIYAQGGSLENHIIFMDEPENHLHPSAVIDLLDKLQNLHPNGQIWIATHSISLLSHFDASSLWFVEGGAITHSGKKPEDVLRSLLGNQERIQKLRDFTSLPDELARNRFAFECLCPPQALETNSNDPQSIQLHEQLRLIWNKKESINLLDFGAGKGRMIANLSDNDNVSSNTLNYHAFDLFDRDKEYCLKNISISYTDAESRYHNSIEDIRSKLDDNYFDVIVLSNVLHEIEYLKWCEIFTEIQKLLKNEGYLLLIEDCLIPTGELAHSNGFVVFSTLHLKKLFKIPATEKNFIQHDARFNSEKQRGRLMAHLIPAEYLKISSETIREALKELKNSAKTEVRKIRNGEITYSNGLAHSFWIQQLANATLCLAELGEE